MSTSKWQGFLQALSFLGVGLLVVWMIGLSVTSYQLLTEIRHTQKSSRSVLDFVNDCTKPSGDCYKAGQAQDAAQVGQINAATIAAAYCATHGEADTYAHATRCVRRLLTKGEGK